MFSLWYLSFIINKTYYLKDKEILCKLECDYDTLERAQNCFSLLKIHLPRELYEKMKYKMTERGSSLYNIIHSGCVHLDSSIGVYAPDPQSYDIFSAVFNPIIEDFHEGFSATSKQPRRYFGELDSLKELDPCGKYVIATKVRCSRNIKGFTFVPTMNECHFLESEAMIKEIAECLCEDLHGTYFYYSEIDEEIKQMLKDSHAFFTNCDRFMEAANVYNLWPVGRGIFVNEDKTLIIFVNQEDHLLLISSQLGSDLRCVYERFLIALNKFERRISFEYHDRLGYLTTCPSNLGTALRASVKIRLPNLSQKEDHLEDICDDHNLLVHTCGNGIYDISNKQRLGCTEYDCIKKLQDGVTEIIQIEKVTSAYFGTCLDEEAPCDNAEYRDFLEETSSGVCKGSVTGRGSRGSRGSISPKRYTDEEDEDEGSIARTLATGKQHPAAEPFQVPCAPGTGLLTPPESQYASEVEDTDVDTSGQTTPGETETEEDA